jgi:hypothetical protein
MSAQEIERLCAGLALGLPLASLAFAGVVLGFVRLGLRAAKSKSRTRWALWTGRIPCPSCQRLVSPSTDICPRCDARLPRIKCPVCGQHDTQILRRPKALRLIAVAMVILSGISFGIAQGTRHDNMAISGPAFVIGVYLAIAGLLVVPLLLNSPWSRRLFCRPCYYRNHKFYPFASLDVEWHDPTADDDLDAAGIEQEACRGPVAGRQ